MPKKHHVRLRVVVLSSVLTIVLSNTADAKRSRFQLFRKTSVNRCSTGPRCCPVPPCKAAPCTCIREVFYGMPGYYLHYAHHHEDCGICNEYTTVIHSAPTILDPQECSLGECGLRNWSSLNATEPGLPAPLQPGEVVNFIRAPEYSVLETMLGSVKLPDGRLIPAEVLLLKLRVEKAGSKRWAYFCFGVQISRNPGNDQLNELELNRHQAFRNIYEGKIGSIPCFILTVGQ